MAKPDNPLNLTRNESGPFIFELMAHRLTPV